MAASMMGSLVVVVEMLVLVASVRSEEWQPCQPYQPHQVNQANFTSWLSPSSHSTSVALQVQQLPWSADFSIMGKRFGVHPHPSYEDMMLINFDGTQDICPTQAFPINKWTNIRFTRKEDVIEVEVLTEHETFSLMSRLSEVCTEAEVKVIQVTSARLSLECPGVCVGQEADQDIHQKHLQDNTHTLILLPLNDCQISMVPKFKNCSEESPQNFTELSHTCQDLGLSMNVWNKVIVTYEEVDGFHGHSLVVNNKTVANFTKEWATSDCHDLSEYLVKVEGSVLWSGEGCEDSLYSDKVRKEGVKNGCTVNITATAATNSVPNEHFPIAVQAEEGEFESTTNTTLPTPPQAKSRPFMSTAALVFLVIIAVIIVIVITRVIWRAVVRKRQRNDTVDYYTLRVDE